MLLEKNIKKKYLVVDDELVENKNDLDDFILDVGVEKEFAFFAGDCDRALEIIQANQDIAICFIDLKIPQNAKNKYEFSSDKLGISLVQQINKLSKNIQIAIYSAYVTKRYLQDLAGEIELNNVVGFYGKPDGIVHRRPLYLNAVNQTALQKQQPINSKVKQNPFNYQDLDLETRLLVVERTEKIRGLLKRSTEDILNIGKYLLEVKKKLGHGKFSSWLEFEFDESLTTAARFMQIYKKFKSFNLKDLNFSHSVLYELAGTSVPNEAIQETLALAKKGEHITINLAKSIKTKHKEIKDASSSLPEVKSGTSSIVARNNISSPIPRTNASTRPVENDTSDSSKQEIVGLISPQRLWHIGKKKHIIVCQDPNSQKFFEQLPLTISLCLAFPPVKNWQFQLKRYQSSLNFYSEYPDIEPAYLLESIKRIIETVTDSDDIIAVCYIPNPQLLLLIDKLDCRAFIAEPDRDKCLALVDASEKLLDQT